MPKQPAKKPTSRKAKPSPQDVQAAERLRKLWGVAPKGTTQAKVASLLDVSQPAISQYLAGEIPLNFKALLAFAQVLGVDPNDIRTDLPEQALLGQYRGAGSSRAERFDDATMTQALELLHAMADARPDDARFTRLTWPLILIAAKAVERAAAGGSQRETVANLLADMEGL